MRFHTLVAVFHYCHLTGIWERFVLIIRPNCNRASQAPLYLIGLTVLLNVMQILFSFITSSITINLDCACDANRAHRLNGFSGLENRAIFPAAWLCIIIISYHIVHFSGASSKNTGAAAIKQTSKFSAVLQMFLQTVSGHECPLASCSRCVGRRRQMICHIVQFLSAGRRASKYQLIACQNDGCPVFTRQTPNIAQNIHLSLPSIKQLLTKSPLFRPTQCSSSSSSSLVW